MFASKFVLAAGLLASTVSALTISTPASLEECVPVAITWTDGTEPYYLEVIPGGDVSGTALENFGDVGDVTTYTWTVDLASGTNITLKVTDSTGLIAYSDAVAISAGTTTCLTSSASGATASASSATSAAAAGATSATSAAASSASSAVSAVSSSAASAVSAASSAAASATSAAASAASSAAASTTSSAASANSVAIGSFGALFLGAIGMLVV